MIKKIITKKQVTDRLAILKQMLENFSDYEGDSWNQDAAILQAAIDYINQKRRSELENIKIIIATVAVITCFIVLIV